MGIYLDTVINSVRTKFNRFNMDYGNLVDMNKVEDAFKNIVVVNKYTSEEVLNTFKVGAFAVYFEGRIYIKEDISIATLFHEVLHYITRDHLGVARPLLESYTEEELDFHIKEYGNDFFDNHFVQINESFTCFITELANPELVIKDGYEYGKNIIKKYYNNLIESGINPDFLFKMYFYNDIESANKFKNSFNGNFRVVLDNIGRLHNPILYLKKNDRKKPLSDEEINAMVDKATDSLKVLK